MLILPCSELSRQGIWRSRHAKFVGLKELMRITTNMTSLSSFDGYAACIIPAYTITARIEWDFSSHIVECTPFHRASRLD
ncbi:protein of unknown function [Agrobacterium pusense]|uniref:Uncharacterized protein n=1 Tax=Agrobacterium pusense TaxID=648995 RepID=U4Q7U5_9HYPH|nr:protein of unknown function [Agrobacterium pusense]